LAAGRPALIGVLPRPWCARATALAARCTHWCAGAAVLAIGAGGALATLTTLPVVAAAAVATTPGAPLAVGGAVGSVGIGGTGWRGSGARESDRRAIAQSIAALGHHHGARCHARGDGNILTINDTEGHRTH
jgi:hypothetical protein